MAIEGELGLRSKLLDRGGSWHRSAGNDLLSSRRVVRWGADVRRALPVGKKCREV